MAKKKTTEKPQRQLTRRQLSHYQKQKRRQRIIFIGGITVIAVIVLLIFVGWLTGEFLPLKETVIEIGEYKYNLGYYIDSMKFYSKDMTPGDVPNLANTMVSQIENNAVLFIGAAQLGITVDEDEVRAELETYDIEVNDASVDILKAQILRQRIKDEYFAEQVPLSANQVNFNAMLLESERHVAEVSERLGISDNFSALAEEYSAHSITKYNKGEFGWHPKEIAESLIGSSIPVEFAFSAEVGELSQALYDDAVSKRAGYWLINVLEKPTEEGANIKVILLSSEDEARDIKGRIETTENLTALIEENSQHAASRTSGGIITAVTRGQMNEPVDGYIFDENVVMGVWSEPIRDETVDTNGGYWLVEVLGKDDDRVMTEEDRTRLISKAFDEWFISLQSQWAASINPTNLTLEKIQWAIEEVQSTLE